jgi:predicted CXXCH cytochrome family protein
MKKFFAASTIILALVSPALALEIIYPENGAWITRSSFLIIKGGDQPPLEGMTVEINGVKSDLIEISAAEYRAAFGDMLILQPDFDPGSNTITVQGYAGGKKVAASTAEIYFVADPMSPPPDKYQQSAIHTPAKEKICAPCHNMNPDKKELSSGGQQNPCASCHKRLLDKKHVHGPAGVWSCTYCHLSDSKPARYQARPGDAKVCIECHADNVGEYQANQFVHGPIEAGMCAICHDSHAGNQVAQLHLPINDLCLRCHEDVGKGMHVVRGVGGKGHPLKGKPDPLRGGREMTCTSCHNPHGGSSNALFQWGVTSRFSLCQKCHQK